MEEDMPHMPLKFGILLCLSVVSIITIIALLPLQGDAFDLMGKPTFSPAIAIATSLILGAVGMFAGYFPARRAAS